MKTLSYRKILIYCLSIVLFISMLFCALTFLAPKRVSASEEVVTTSSESDFSMTVYQAKYVNDESKGYMNLKSYFNIEIGSDIYNKLTTARYEETGSGYKGLSKYDAILYRDYYIAVIRTKNLKNYREANKTVLYSEIVEDSVLNFGLNEVDCPDIHNLKLDGCEMLIYSPNPDAYNNYNVLGATEYQCILVDEFSTACGGHVNLPAWKTNEDYYVFSAVISVERLFVQYVTHVVTDVRTYTEGVEISIVDVTSNYLTINEPEIYKDELNKISTSYNTPKAQGYQKALGIYNETGEATLTVNYIKMKSFTEYENASVSCIVKSAYAQSPIVLENLMAPLLSAQGFNDLTSFNASYVGNYIENGLTYNTEERIIREALSFKFNVDYSQSNTITVDVVYSDFYYKDLSMRITNNDDTNHLTMNVYTTNVSEAGNNYVLTFDYVTMQEQLYNSCNWLFALDKEHVSVSGLNSNVSVDITGTHVQVTVAKTNEQSLFGLTLTAVAEIVEDEEYVMTYDYITITSDFQTETLTSSPIIIMYSELQNINSINFKIKYGDVITNALTSKNELGADVCEYSKIERNYNHDNNTCKITVIYNYKPTFVITNNLNNEIKYFPITSNTNLTFTLSQLEITAPSGYRIAGLKSNSTSVTTTFYDRAPLNSYVKVIELDTSYIQVFDVELTYSDKWFVSIDYLDKYKNTPFAESKHFDGEIKVANYSNIYEITSSELASILGRQSMNVLLSTVDSINVTFDNKATYYITVNYTNTAISAIDYDGKKVEYKVPLSSYAEWLELYGQDWTILFLNNEQAKYFNYVNDVEPEKLYGYFSVAVFKEQVKDFNNFFKKDSYIGCVSFFDSVEISGSDLYKKFGSLKDSVFGLVGDVGMAICEVANDDNAMYHSYFFFLNGDLDTIPVISNGGADHANDTDGAFENTVQDGQEAVDKFFDDIFGGFEEWWENSPEAQAIEITLWVIGGVLALSVIVWALRKAKIIK